MINLRPACLMLLMLALATHPAVGQQVKPDEFSFRVTVTVEDQSGRLFLGLTQQEFSVFENKTPLAITYFDAGDTPASVAFVFDLSTWVGPTFRKLSSQVAAQMILDGHKTSEYAIIGVKNKPEILCELGCSQADIVTTLQEVTVFDPEGTRKSGLYDACDLALKKLETSKNVRRALIVFSDGLDNTSEVSFPKLRKVLKESGVLFYALGLVSPTLKNLHYHQVATDNLDELGEVTGGRSFFLTDKNGMIDQAKEISTHLQHHYTIGFKPATPVADNKWHPIKIKLTLPKSGKYPTPTVRYRDGYVSR